MIEEREGKTQKRIRENDFNIVTVDYYKPETVDLFASLFILLPLCSVCLFFVTFCRMNSLCCCFN